MTPVFRSSQTVRNFLHGVTSASMGEPSFLALRAKTATLLQRAVQLAACTPKCMFCHSFRFTLAVLR